MTHAPIVILGTGKMATAIARRLAAAGAPFVVGSRDPARARALAASLGGDGADLATAARAARVLVLAVPYTAAAATLAQLGPLDGKILVDISNPVTPDFMALTVGHTTSAAEQIQRLAPGAHVVKAYNTIFADVFAAPDTRAVQVFYAGDDAAARAEVAALIERTGFRPVDAGPLANARYLEPVGELNIHFGFALGRGTRVAPAWLDV